MFPVSMKGTVQAKTAGVLDADLLKTKICEDLRRQHIAYQVDENEIHFVNHSYSVFTMTRYSVVDHGSFVIKPNEIYYRLSTKILTLVGSLLSLIMGLFFLAHRNQSGVEWLLVPVATWILLVGVNYAMIRCRNFSFLRRLVTAA